MQKKRTNVSFTYFLNNSSPWNKNFKILKPASSLHGTQSFANHTVTISFLGHFIDWILRRRDEKGQLLHHQAAPSATYTPKY
jgi:hypothetical protein